MAVDLEMRDELDAYILPWIDINTRDMFGGACYLVKGKIFAVITGGGVIMKLPQEHRQKALALPGVAPSTYIRGRPVWRMGPVHADSARQRVERDALAPRSVQLRGLPSQTFPQVTRRG